MIGIEKHLKGKSHIIWDWNGTLLNDIDLCVQVVSHLLADRGLRPIDRHQYRQSFRFPVVEYYEDLGFDTDQDSFEQISREFIQIYQNQVHSCSLFNGCTELLQELSSQGIRHSILSAAHEQDLKTLLNRYGIADHFDHVCGQRDHYAHGKLARGRELINQLKASPDQVMLVGDTDHDAQVARELNIDALILADGHQCLERLRRNIRNQGRERVVENRLEG